MFDFLKKASPPLPKTVSDLKAVHPFYPVGVEIANFIANDISVGQLLGIFASGCAVILAATWFLASKVTPQLKKKDKLIILWFCLSKNTTLPRVAGRQD